MTELVFAKDVRSAVRGVVTVCLAVPASKLTPKTVGPIVGPRLLPMVMAMARDAKPGDNGKVMSTFTGLDSPRRVMLCVLPDRVSRHNSPTRAEALRRFALACEGESGRRAVLIVADSRDHALASYNALAKAMPLFTAKSEAKKDDGVAQALVVVDGHAVPAGIREQETCRMTRLAARLVDTPPATLTTAEFAREAREALRGLRGVKVSEIVGDRLLRAGLGGIHGVGRAATVAPRMLVATHAPAKAEGHVALVGKGVVFDTGGLHLKARGAMEGMKGDMGGAAATLGAFRVLVKAGYPHRLSLVLCLAENAIGPSAFKPDDVLTLHSGRTVEINNTDAEGRLLLADGCSWAARELGAKLILDAATLTGAQMIATGLMHAGVVSNDAEVEQALCDAGRASGDLVHPLPFAPEFYKAEFASPVADMRNSVANRNNAQSSCAAQFIYWHIENTGARWGHVDLAGPATLKDRGTGFGVALLAETVLRLA